MKTELHLDSISSELDAVHAAARQAFLARDLNSYQDFFTDDLRYLQADGKPIGRKQLMRDVAKQLSQFKAVDSEITRESILINDDGTVSQIIRQNGSYSVSVFFFFTKTWKIERKGKYTYRKTDDEWKICDVEVQSEAVNSISRAQKNEK